MSGIWGRLDRGELTASQYKEEFEKLSQETFGRIIPEEILSRWNDSHNVIEPYPNMIDAIKCIRAEGVKTALLTNNYFIDGSKSFMPLEKDLFNVVRYFIFF